MKRFLISILLLFSFLQMGEVVTFGSSTTTIESTYDIDMEKNNRLGADYGLEETKNCKPEILSDLSFRTTSNSVTNPLRRIQTHLQSVFWKMQKEMKKIFSSSIKTTTTATSVAIRRITSVPITTFIRICDLYVFSYGHILN